jgi:hypothetical protein
VRQAGLLPPTGRLLATDRSRLVAAAFAWIGFTVATTHWMAWGEPIHKLYASDELQYEAIARAAPGLTDARVSAAASQRFVSHWLVGVAADVTHLGLHTAYRIVTFACLLAIAAVVVRIALALALPSAAGVVALGLVVTNPYTWRLALIAPAMLSDELLVLGVAVALLGLVENRPWIAICGCVIAVLGRETGLPVAVGVAAWLLVRRRRRAAATAVFLTGATFAAVKAVGESFSLPDPPAHAFTVVSPILRLPGTARELADHIGRVALVSPASLALLGASVWVLWRGSRRWLDPPLAMALTLAGLTVLQAAVFNPDWVQLNESRLAALGIAPLALATAIAFARTPLVASRGACSGIVLGIALASLHHRYTWGGLIESPRVYVGIEAFVALALGVLVLAAGRELERRGRETSIEPLSTAQRR